MKYFKDKNNQIYALDEQDVANFKKQEWSEISKDEVDRLLNPAQRGSTEAKRASRTRGTDQRDRELHQARYTDLKR